MAKRLIATGLVQGVGYRASFAERAIKLGLAGWVRNRPDGSVEACVQGDERAILAIVEWSRVGPVGARVDHVALEDVTGELITDGRFEIRASV